ncbi:MAG: glycoside hydrolase family 3 N-terminal domain-containing protein [Elusimicrobiota bacterium]
MNAILPFVLAVSLVPALVLAKPLRQPETEKKVEALLKKMTLEEKFGQLQQLGDGGKPGEFEDLARKGLLGSMLNVMETKRKNAIQRAALESRMKIPVLFGADVIHGYRTMFPVPIAEASSWDPAAVELSASIAAREAAATGIRWTFAPMVDIARDPRWGRIMEGSGEDPYLGAAMARARVRGFQGKDMAAPDRIAACAKHWAAYGAAEAGRDYNTTDVSERTLREVYFPPFKAAVEEGVATLMSSFNDLNGIPATANRWLQTEVLRKEWGFDGFVVSDYTAVMELINHGVAADEADAGLKALKAGVDMEMVSRSYVTHGPRLVKEGKLSLATVDEAVRRVLRIKFLTGAMDRPLTDESLEAKAVFTPEHLAAAHKVALKSMVLLKNEEKVLPLRKDLGKLALIGPLADDQEIFGGWAIWGRKEDTVSLRGAVEAKLGSPAKVLYAKGCEMQGGTEAGFAEAVAAAKAADAVVLVLGESPNLSGEASSRSSIGLPGLQMDLAKAVLAAGKPAAVVLMNGRPLTLGWLADHAPAILEAWFGGTRAGMAVADILFGDVNPGGKLPATFPRVLGQVPIYYNHKKTGRPYDPSNNYTTHYLDVPNEPQYPFGWGLSYTTFALKDLALDRSRIAPGGRVTVSVSVTNTGPVAGDEVVQIYIRDLVSSASRPVRELKGFERITLKPQETRRLSFALGPKELGAYDESMRWRVEPGRFQVLAGTDSTGGLEAFFEVAAVP